ncbi:sulfotransferase family 2 domain-containing protein [Wenyingzhuangia sp. IMCC45533]
MISHKHKCIFIHIPKTAGSSVSDFFINDKKKDWEVPDYDILFGWCPKRKIHLQHATASQLLETELISEEIWKSYFKFSFVRNPWDRSYSDYLWMMKDRKVKGSFEDYILKKGKFEKVLTDSSNKHFRGDHLIEQSEFLETKDDSLNIDFIGRFENFKDDMAKINNVLGVNSEMNLHKKKNKKRHDHYSLFYTESRKRLVHETYGKDIIQFDYSFEDKKKGLQLLKNFF